MNIPATMLHSVATKISDLAFASICLWVENQNQPDNCVTIFGHSRSTTRLNYDKNFKVAYPSVQIRVRNISYKDWFGNLQFYKSVLHNIGNEKK